MNPSLQNTSINAQSQRSRFPNLSQLDFISTLDRSKGFNKHVFYLDVRKTLSDVGHAPSLATSIPSTNISENKPGFSYLDPLCFDLASTNIAES